MEGQGGEAVTLLPLGHDVDQLSAVVNWARSRLRGEVLSALHREGSALSTS